MQMIHNEVVFTHEEMWSLNIAYQLPAPTKAAVYTVQSTEPGHQRAGWPRTSHSRRPATLRLNVHPASRRYDKHIHTSGYSL